MAGNPFGVSDRRAVSMIIGKQPGGLQAISRGLRPKADTPGAVSPVEIPDPEGVAETSGCSLAASPPLFGGRVEPDQSHPHTVRGFLN